MESKQPVQGSWVFQLGSSPPSLCPMGDIEIEEAMALRFNAISIQHISRLQRFAPDESLMRKVHPWKYILVGWILNWLDIITRTAIGPMIISVLGQANGAHGQIMVLKGLRYIWRERRQQGFQIENLPNWTLDVLTSKLIIYWNQWSLEKQSLPIH